MLDLVREEAWNEALVALLAKWRETPAAPIADAIRAVGERALEDVPAIWGNSEGLRWNRIRALATSCTPAETGRVLAEIARTRWALSIGVLEALMEQGDDPRISDAMFDFVERRLRVRAIRYSDCWPKFWKLFARCSGIRERVERIGWSWRDTRWAPGRHEAVDPDRDRLLEILRPSPELSADDTAMYREIVELARTCTSRRDRRETERAALLANIYADPSPGSKAIYGDWLQQHGDPRGTFIALQLKSPSFTATERALVRRHDAEWRWPLPKRALNVEYRHGFPITAHETGPIDDEPAWATIESASGPPRTDHANVRSLRRFHGFSDDSMIELVHLTKPLPVEELEWTGGTRNAAVFDALAKITVLAALSTLRVRRGILARHEVDRVLAAPFVTDLDYISIPVELIDFATIATRVPELPQGVVTLALPNWLSWTAMPDAENRLTRIALRMRDFPGERITSIFIDALASLPTRVVTSLSLEIDPRFAVTTGQRIRDALGAQTEDIRIVPFL
ncbi:MAG: TIGR02996 domain-containing protein [Kofleriaceae bacterium]